jgi:hypothetical protein
MEYVAQPSKGQRLDTEKITQPFTRLRALRPGRLFAAGPKRVSDWPAKHRMQGPMPFSIPAFSIPVVTIGLLLASNIFMTFAWYGHLKFKETPLVTVILVSWGIAFFEYLLMVPANRIGHGHFSAAELKTIQEVITLSVFAVFSVLYLKEPLSWNHLVGFAFIGLGAFFIFHKWA